ncbi:acyl-CoA dehydrogenase family protein [Streptomyces jumonjinensis]|uniref:Acyl-CoA dehydrogenase n=1 Tax=Streptomyces jumonjinensis TaxID=1945 RepID=A0A646KQW1_STRJU|nr:acyl-CoA dehydrogenase family protein [Streptomyces jumonjinensis]MQT04682.1 acyl-CoA dehydrogenase [Streptomyces jumonjinensis]
MTVTANVPGHDMSLPPEPGLTPDDILARAEAIAPTLTARQAETEQRTFYAPDTHEAFRAAGFYRILVPRRYGGYEFGVGTFMRVVMALSRGCPSTGWMYCLGAAHAHAVATLFDERVQREVFADGDFICPATVAPSGTAERADDGQWVLNGVWNYCSGSPYATHFVGHTLIPGGPGADPRPMMFIAPSSEFRRLDDWGRQLGLRGSGSHSIAIENGRIPGHWTLPMHMSEVDVLNGTPGLALHGNPMYGGGPLSFMVLEDAALAIGMAQGALDAYEELLRTKRTMFPPIAVRSEDPDFQFWYGEAAGLIASAEAAFLNAIRQWDEAAAAGPGQFTPERELRIITICREAVKQSWRAVESHLFPTAGSSAVKEGERMERVWRDLSMQHSHAGIAVFLSAIANREYTKSRFPVVQ